MKLMLIAGLCIVYVICVRILASAIRRIGESKSVDAYRINYITRTLTLLMSVGFLILGIISLGIEYTQLSVFMSSVFAVIGVAFFAQWSILSNITGSLIIFFAFPYRVGDTVKVVDKDDEIVGVIEEISLFHVIMRRGDDIVTYPNSLILQKAVIKFSGTPAEVAAAIEKEKAAAQSGPPAA